MCERYVFRVSFLIAVLKKKELTPPLFLRSRTQFLAKLQEKE